MSELRVRVAAPDDAAAVADVYRPDVTETAVTSEETVPDAGAVAGDDGAGD